MVVRTAKAEDLADIVEIYRHAREYMAENGNPHQWGDDGYPAACLIEEDIDKQRLYVVCDDGCIEGVFMFEKGPDESYLQIDGAWQNDEPYYVIHRIASSGRVRGILKTAVDFALKHCNNIKMDTYCENTVMQKALTKLGFKYCGTVYIKTMLSDRAPRMAYQLSV